MKFFIPSSIIILNFDEGKCHGLSFRGMECVALFSEKIWRLILFWLTWTTCSLRNPQFVNTRFKMRLMLMGMVTFAVIRPSKSWIQSRLGIRIVLYRNSRNKLRWLKNYIQLSNKWYEKNIHHSTFNQESTISKCNNKINQDKKHITLFDFEYAMCLQL